MTRRKFSRDFKVEAVRLVADRRESVAQAARDLDVAESVPRRWMRELTATPVTAFSVNGQMRADLAEIAALMRHANTRHLGYRGSPAQQTYDTARRALNGRPPEGQRPICALKTDCAISLGHLLNCDRVSRRPQVGIIPFAAVP